MSVKLKLKPKTPKKINSAVKKLINSLGINNSPFYLPLTKVDYSRAGYCFNNCEQYAKNNKASVVYGWMIWEDRKSSFIEAEFHAVINENGQYKDISPRVNNEDKILFVIDNSRNSGRKESDSWYSWTNIKIFDGIVQENPKPIEIKELDDDYCEMIHLS
ncbi:SEC-C metal-binding protein [Enterobacter sp. FY-07]|uniref:hypothetical protein n=1 Tax=Kosakonia oryzendophytica TaxID=1005665 RepID=UPI0007770565|nr:hypothetical protein [Kosakonia oryzendophytica]AMO49469.1 SEC-C metal-binding protein [Enterobacter sp. FY-07]AMO49481.1 SEC-C metal-binding protein [Enterobacter sp. FY-07]WBT56067.1 hypothetical protein O9K67_12710 [Kosakonia oryzendophytica]WBT56078.1 hypothetical protein O9K67_12775 [Kosakonia oryzendophytica]